MHLENEFKIRASQLGKIMTSPKKGSDYLLSVGAKTYCKDWLKEAYFGRKNVLVSKYTTKGNLVENEGIKMLSEYLNYGLLFKNEKQYEDEYFIGTPDIVLKSDKVTIDIKSSWSFDTFPFFEQELPNKDYYYQGQQYMHQTGCTKHIVAYILSDTPSHLIESEARRYCFINGISDTIGEIDINIMFEKHMSYSDIPIKDRIRIFELEYDPKCIEKAKEKVMHCREYINQLTKNLKL